MSLEISHGVMQLWRETVMAEGAYGSESLPSSYQLMAG